MKNVAKMPAMTSQMRMPQQPKLLTRGRMEPGDLPEP
jgi:hypothetical protein